MSTVRLCFSNGWREKIYAVDSNQEYSDLHAILPFDPSYSLCLTLMAHSTALIRSDSETCPAISTARLAWRWRSWLSKRRKLTLSTLVINLLTYLPNLRLTGRVENVTKKCFTVIRKGAMRRFRSAYSRRKLYVGSTFPIRFCEMQL